MNNTALVRHSVTKIGPGTCVRLAKAANLKDRMARWIVKSCDAESAIVVDCSDEQDERHFTLTQLERVGGGVEEVSVIRIELKDEDEEDDELQLYWGEDGFLHFADEGEGEVEDSPKEYRSYP